ncbi:hypothetical protein [Nocardioides immobilis]|nr:hypothetical protein [Nocardioides immobilis]
MRARQAAERLSRPGDLGSSFNNVNVGTRPYRDAMHMSSRKFIGGVEVVPGAQVSHGPPRSLAFQVWSVCEQSQPERWHGEVRFNSTTVLRTDTVNDHGQAARLAEEALAARVVELFSR